ncbi:hypothetical protein [Agromyces humi]|uniref:hypothetical protein n=1 Tax=Agromyces humi TaxID=1766800 RepID=UPI001356D5C6|nr:hypothetical protein [Agromyces humi]
MKPRTALIAAIIAAIAVGATVYAVSRHPLTKSGTVTVKAIEDRDGRRRYRLDVRRNGKTGWRFVTEAQFGDVKVGDKV